MNKVVVIENEIFWLSNKTYNSIIARETCSSINGKLARLDNAQVKDVLLPIFEELYLQGIRSKFCSVQPLIYFLPHENGLKVD